MLRIYPDRAVAKEAARVNVSALAAGQARIITPEHGRTARQVTQAIAHGGENLGLIQRALATVIKRVPSVMIERLITAPQRERE